MFKQFLGENWDDTSSIRRVQSRDGWRDANHGRSNGCKRALSNKLRAVGTAVMSEVKVGRKLSGISISDASSALISADRIKGMDGGREGEKKGGRAEGTVRGWQSVGY